MSAGKTGASAGPPEWALVVVMPAAKLPRAVMAGNLAAIPPDDAAYGNLAEPKRVGPYLERFETPFGERLRPVVIARRAGTPPPDLTELIHFRNALAVAALVEGRARRCRNAHSSNATHADLFDLCPINLRLTRRGLIVESAGSELGTHADDETFRGQGTPVYAYPGHLAVELDGFLLDALLALWRNTNPRKARFRRRVFRSLELAFSAMRAPAPNLNSTMDHGVTLALWVSAFETLANEKRGAGVTFHTVRDLIEGVPWADERCVRLKRRFEHRSAHFSKGKKPGIVSRPVEMYGRLYRARNLALHGERLPPNGLEPGRQKSWGRPDWQAAALYRSVLLWHIARRGFGTFPKRPRERKRYTTAQRLREWEQHAEARFAHDLFEGALVDDYSEWWEHGRRRRSGRRPPSFAVHVGEAPIPPAPALPAGTEEE